MIVDTESSSALVADGPALRRAGRVVGRTLALRDATVADAGYVLSLRTDPVLSAHLSTTPARLPDQQAWLRDYAGRDGEAYFIIETAAGQPIGTVRLYDARGDSFCWGSWILQADAPAHAAIESALVVYAYAIDTLGFTAAHFSVNNANQRVRAFHERFGARVVAGDDHEQQFTIDEPAIRASMQRYSRYLPKGVEVMQ